VSLRPVEFAARDGFRLGGILYRPAQPNGRAVLVNGAVGVRQQHYAAFAAFLEERGFTVLTYDYRGIAASRHGPLRALEAHIRDWAQLDAAAALDELARAAPGARLQAVGHSFGGNSLGLVPGIERLAGALFVGVQSGYWRHWRGPGRAGMWFLTHALLPESPRPGFARTVFGAGEDRPRASPPNGQPGAATTTLPERRRAATLASRHRSALPDRNDHTRRAATEAILREHLGAKQV
jgi:predicted alpha/beta hydrolase